MKYYEISCAEKALKKKVQCFKVVLQNVLYNIFNNKFKTLKYYFKKMSNLPRSLCEELGLNAEWIKRVNGYITKGIKEGK